MTSGRKPLVFVVEDNELYSLSLDFGLSHAGAYEVKTFKDAEDCIRHLNMNPDVVIADYLLPGKSGRDVLLAVKEKDPHIPVIIMSAQNDIQVAVDLLKEGAHDYVIKGKHATIKLASIIEKLLSYKQVKEENVVLKIQVNKFKAIVAALLVLLVAFIIFIIWRAS